MCSVFVLLRAQHVVVADGRTGGRRGRVPGEVGTGKAGGASEAVSGGDGAGLRQAADGDAVLVLWEHRGQGLWVRAVAGKGLLESRWHVRVALRRQERVADHVRERKRVLGIRVHRQMLGKHVAAGQGLLLRRLSCRDARRSQRLL